MINKKHEQTMTKRLAYIVGLIVFILSTMPSFTTATMNHQPVQKAVSDLYAFDNERQVNHCYDSERVGETNATNHNPCDMTCQCLTHSCQDKLLGQKLTTAVAFISTRAIFKVDDERHDNAIVYSITHPPRV